jgi:hypothetical protein
MTTQNYAGAVPYESEASGAGWVSFAAIMLALAGVWNVIDGMLAIGSSRVYGPSQTFVFSDLNTWGWIILALGVIQLLAAYSIIAGSEVGRWFGIGAAFVNGIGQLFFIPAYPWWSIAMFTVDLIVIYALAVYGGSRLRRA